MDWREAKRKGARSPEPLSYSYRLDRLVAIARQERRRELGRGAVVVAAFATLAARAAIATLAAAIATRATVAAAIAARTTIATATAVATRTTAAIAVAARSPRGPRSPPSRGSRGGTGVLQLGAGLLVDDAHRQADLAARVDLEDLDLDLLAFGQDVGDLLDPLVA